MPSLTSTSLWQMPHASTFTRTCPLPGSGISRSTNSQSPPGLLICANFILLMMVGGGILEGGRRIDLGGGSWGGRRNALASVLARQQIHQLADHDVEDRCEHEAEEGDTKHAVEHCRSECAPHLR